MINHNRRTIIQSVAAMGTYVITNNAFSQVKKEAPPVRIGYSTSKSGRWAGSAKETQEPMYLFWADKINAKGGLDIQGVKRKIELVVKDEQSDVEACVRNYEELVNVDKVDLLLPPWGNVANIAVAPLFNKYEFVHLPTTIFTNQILKMNLPYVFVMLAQPTSLSKVLVEYLKDQGVKTVGLIYNDEFYRLENYASFKLALNKTNIKIVEDHSISLGGAGLEEHLKSIQNKNPDAFIAFSNLNENFLIIKEAKKLKYNPKHFYVGIGASYNVFKRNIGSDAEGIIGMTSANRKSNPELEKLFLDYKKFNKIDTDTHVGPPLYASLEIIEAAVKNVGLNKKQIRNYIAENTHKTIIGDIAFKNSENISIQGIIGQWQGNDFELVWPKDRATAKTILKPEWK